VTELEARPLPGLPDADVDAIEQFAPGVRERMDAADPADRHRIYELLHLRGTVHHDPDGGLQFGKKRFSIEWMALVSLRIQGR